MINLFRIPMPPQSNGAYVTDKKTFARYPSKQLKLFKKEFSNWCLINGRSLGAVKRLVKDMHTYPDMIQIKIERFFVFHRPKVFTKDFHVKIMDVSNRIKALDDALSGAIGIDDSRFFEGSETKIWTQRAEDEQVIVTISLTTPKYLTDLVIELGELK